MNNKSFKELIKEKKGEKYLTELNKEIRQEIEKQKFGKQVYVKDSEGFAAYKPESALLEDDIVISESEYNRMVGNAIKKYAHGGIRAGSGRKKKFRQPQKATFEFEEETLIKLKDYAQKHKISQNELVNMAVKKIINE